MTVWIGTSWKMNKTLAEAVDYAGGLRQALSGRSLGSVQPFIIPPATALASVAGVLDGTSVLVGAQNAHWEDAGAWTGEVSVPQVSDAGARLVEIGHSERREHFGETDETVRKKVDATLRHGLIPLLCIGEPDEVHNAGTSSEYILEQARRALDGLEDALLAKVLIAYEPIWAIGAGGRPAHPDELRAPFAALAGTFGGRVAGLLYGGSVDLANASGLLDLPHVDGLFVGRAAWALEGYVQLLDLAAGLAGGDERRSEMEGVDQ
ncbi:triose-phosphate isomerase [Arthrobacter sp. BL-252-APC-1A]|uniref:triose-phosphate isomerase n=1 Tax=Arthrobacter sp. BL-252-APC-1A TaxID=2606622 RepID=UPI0013100379|nr:triose-phosphate isomerase [Arthrobacter sp. BL-252-APC-1A]MSR99940.1 triose-phosphate isomerase [Arthrobacter sp. BL-252-APC-1A]